MLSQAADGTLANDLYTVSGILMSVAAATDRGTIFLTEHAFRELFVFPEGAHRIIVRSPPDVDVAAATASRRGAGSGPRRPVVEAAQPVRRPDARRGRLQMTIVYFVHVRRGRHPDPERDADGGVRAHPRVRRAQGHRLRPGQVLVMMIAEGLLQAVVAAGLGCLLALPCVFYLQVFGIDVGRLGGVSMMGMTMPTIWRGDLHLRARLSVPVLMLFVIVFFAVLYPAAKAAWIRPVEAMHHQ